MSEQPEHAESTSVPPPSSSRPASEPAIAPAPRERPAWLGWMIFVAALAATFVLGLLAASIIERRHEAAQQVPITPIDPQEMDAARWGENFPREYDSYLRMRDTSTKTRYGGSYQRDLLAETPANVVLFAGYGFGVDYKQARGHAWALEDVTASPRVGEKTPATCFTCKGPDSARLITDWGPAKFYAKKFSDVKDQIKHPISCYDCHEANTMRLRILRPALREAFKRQGRDIDQVSHQEMRSLVCAQCHVTYYFKTEGNYLTFPWTRPDSPQDNGTAPEDIERYFDDNDFSDFKNAISQTSMLKMRHPDWELYRTGVHSYRNVSCADCHMPYRTEGGAKFTDHHVQSPLLNIANSCAVCHRWSEYEIRNRVYAIQDKVHEARGRAEASLARAHFDIAAAAQSGADDKELADARRLVRRAQMRWDYVAASNGMGFHSPQESMRILDAALDLSAECRLDCARTLARHGVTRPVEYPDFGSKEKAQGLVKQFVEKKPVKLVKEGEK